MIQNVTFQPVIISPDYQIGSEDEEMELKNYWRAVKKRLWLILFCVIAATATTAYYTFDRYTPQYMASSKLVINHTFSNDSGVETMDIGAMNTNIRLIETYKEIIRSSAIMEKVVEKYPELRATSDELIRAVNVYSVNNTQIMMISAVGASYDRTAKIVNGVTEVFRSEVPRIMKINNVNLLTEAPMLSHPQPFNEPAISNLLLSFIIALLFSIGLIFLLEYLDDTIKTEDDILKVFDVPILASVTAIEKKDMRRHKPLKAGESYAAVNR